MTPTVLNGRERELPDELGGTLLDWLRENLSLRGSKLGCGEGRCGACTVLVDGRAVLSCMTPLGQVAGRVVTTIEGLTGDPHGEEAMAQLAAEDALQCGFCTPGIVVTLAGMTKQAGTPLGLDQVRAGLAGNLCRCTGYRPIVAAALRVHAPAEPTERGWGAPVAAANYRRPATLAEALEIRAAAKTWTPVAGGTDLYAAGGTGDPLLDLSGIAELTEISETAQQVRIGGTATYRQLIESPMLQRWCAPLTTAAALIGGAQVQNQATLGGALASAAPTADALPTLAVVDATIELRSANTTRLVAYDDFLTGPRATVLGADELITAIIIDKTERTISLFRKAGARRAQSVSLGSVALRADWDGRHLSNATVCFGAIDGPPRACTEASDILMAGPLDQARVVAAAGAAVVTDGSAEPVHRARLREGLLLRACHDAGLLTPSPTAEVGTVSS